MENIGPCHTPDPAEEDVDHHHGVGDQGSRPEGDAAARANLEDIGAAFHLKGYILDEGQDRDDGDNNRQSLGLESVCKKFGLCHIVKFLSRPQGPGSPQPPRNQSERTVSEDVKRSGSLGIGPSRPTQIGEGAEDGPSEQEIHDEKPQVSAGCDILHDGILTTTAGKRPEKQDEEQIDKHNNNHDDPGH